MTLDMVLNELSLRSPAPDITTACSWMSCFIQTVKGIKKKAGSQALLRTQYEFYDTNLAPDYPLRRWLNDVEVDREQQRFIKSLATKSPFSEDTLESAIEEVENNVGAYEFRYQNERAIGLGVASILDIIPVSFISETCWDCCYINLDVIKADDDDEKLTIVHCSRPEHLNEHLSWISCRLRRDIYDGLTLLERREDLFPNLYFSDTAKEQLKKLQAGDIMLNPVEKGLSDLQQYSTIWLQGAFDASKIGRKATPESKATLEKYTEERTFLCSDNQERIFSWHIRLTPQDWRIYFFPEQPGKLFIGYIGRHLRTVQFG